MEQRIFWNIRNVLRTKNIFPLNSSASPSTAMRLLGSVPAKLLVQSRGPLSPVLSLAAWKAAWIQVILPTPEHPHNAVPKAPHRCPASSANSPLLQLGMAGFILMASSLTKMEAQTYLAAPWQHFQVGRRDIYRTYIDPVQSLDRT